VVAETVHDSFPSMQVALLGSGLHGATADAPPLSSEAAEAFALQRSASPGLKRCGDICRALQLPTTLASPCELSDAAHLPTRVLAGNASEQERALWRAYYESAVHEMLSTELVDALADHIRKLVAYADDRTPPDAAVLVAGEDTGTEHCPQLPTVLEIGGSYSCTHAGARARAHTRTHGEDACGLSSSCFQFLLFLMPWQRQRAVAVLRRGWHSF